MCLIKNDMETQWSCRTQLSLRIIFQVDPICMLVFFPPTFNCTGQTEQAVRFNQSWVLQEKYNEANEGRELKVYIQE